MAATILHFGYDYCYRVSLLRSAGYAVKEARSLSTLERNLKQNPVQAVILSETNPRIAERVADVVRQHSRAPVILFRRSPADLDVSKFDQIYSASVSPPVWLLNIEALIAQRSPLCAGEARVVSNYFTDPAEPRM